jgi:DNA helicase IV
MFSRFYHPTARVHSTEIVEEPVFVPSEDAVRKVSELLSGSLRPHNIPVDACHDGRVLGTQAKVRVFNVEFIKGLEFEAVFFVDVDELAQSVPELVDRYLYVGLTRARSFLAVTSRSGFPRALRHVQQSFVALNWQRFAESSSD